jgi:hypothetical protein
MSKSVAGHLRIAVCSFLAFVAAASSRFVSAEAQALRAEPRFGEPPAGAGLNEPGASSDRVAELEKQVARLNAELANLRRALDVMGPLPDHAQYFVPVEMNEPAAPANYAIAPKLQDGQSLFYEADLATFSARADAEAAWARFAAHIDQPGLEPRYDSASSTVRLGAGPFTNQASIDALCVELAALTAQCGVTAPIRAF